MHRAVEEEEEGGFVFFGLVVLDKGREEGRSRFKAGERVEGEKRAEEEGKNLEEREETEERDHEGDSIPREPVEE